MPLLDRPAVRVRLSELHARAKPVFSWLPLAGLVPSFLLATWSLAQPWAEGRAFFLVGISRSPGALLLVLITLLGMLGAGVGVATRGKQHGLAAVVHLASGVVMGLVAFVAFQMIQDAPTRLLGVIPVATVGPGPGLRSFLGAAACVFMLGVFELAVWLRRRTPREETLARGQCATTTDRDCVSPGVDNR